MHACMHAKTSSCMRHACYMHAACMHGLEGIHALQTSSGSFSLRTTEDLFYINLYIMDSSILALIYSTDPSLMVKCIDLTKTN